MKLTSYSFCLLLAMASGATPASAQHIFFSQSPLANKCTIDLFLYPANIGLRAHSGRSVTNATVEEVEHNGIYGYYTTRSLVVRELATCFFDQCILQHSLRLTCVGGLASETVTFKWRKRLAKKR